MKETYQNTESILKGRNYKFYVFLIMLFMCFDLLCPIFANKFMIVPWGSISITTFLSPLTLLVGDIIGEIYGFNKTTWLIIFSTLGKSLFIFICNILIIYSPFDKSNFNAYNFIFTNDFYNIINISISIFCAWNLNNYFLSKLKILYRGKYFWLRSVGCSVIYETTFQAFIVILFLTYKPDFYLHRVLHMFVFGVFVRILVVAVLAFPSSLIVTLLKIIDTPNFESINQ